MPPSRIPITFGSRFGDLVVLGDGEHRLDGRGHTILYARVACICGKQFDTPIGSLRNGNTKTCGCGRARTLRISRKSQTHGMTGTPTYGSWASMRVRCLNPERKGFYLWGGRGITICERWTKFENFYADMGERPYGCTLDRIDVNGNYEPENCRWADKKTQGFNMRKTIPIKVYGKTLCMADAVKLIGVNCSSVREYAEARGWTYQQAVDHYATNGKSR